ncbi:MAG: hypothetical protein ACXVZP_10890 [Gaiellaceae bacterium]
MLGLSQRHGLGVLFAAIALVLAGIGIASARAAQWPLAAAAIVLALWMGSLSLSALRPRSARK